MAQVVQFPTSDGYYLNLLKQAGYDGAEELPFIHECAKTCPYETCKRFGCVQGHELRMERRRRERILNAGATGPAAE